ncbi:MAG TPA: hypothetical protein PLH85_07620 [Rhodocyclaceae bacterium]|nr:hypothetical protein [Rhodocyclaceae bacterium]
MSQSDDNAATDSSLPDDGVFSEPLRRVSFEPGMLLGIEATRAEQAYHRRRHTRHAYWLHGAGTVAGLRVVMDSTPPKTAGKPWRVRLIITPGIGVDGLGREVSVHEPYAIDLGDWLTAQHADSTAWGALERDGLDTAGTTLYLRITMRYQDVPSGLQPVMATAINAGTDPVGPSRIQDTVLYELTPWRPAIGDVPERPFTAHDDLSAYDDIADRLADHERAAIAAADAAGRRQLQLGARLLFALSDDNTALATRESLAVTAAELARTLLATVTIALDPGGQLVIDPARIVVDNLARPFLFNASTLARLLRQ